MLRVGVADENEIFIFFVTFEPDACNPERLSKEGVAVVSGEDLSIG
ncbi:MAG: hypothetical protein R2865_00150 [Deinococcales bacterium]